MRRIRPIVVLGPERSGTSAWAELIYEWGAYSGDEDELPEPDQLNPHGRWEYRPLWDLLELIGDFGIGVRQMGSHGQPWLWKDPALCHFLPFWRQIWQNPVYVIAVRHPLDIARSWQQFARGNKRDPTSVRCNLLRWQYMTSQVLAETTSASANLFVEYERLMQQPEAQARQLASFLSTHCGGPTRQSVVMRMAAACDPALWRNRNGYQFGSSHLTAEQADLYARLRAKVADATAPIRLAAMPVGGRRIVVAAEANANHM